VRAPSRGRLGGVPGTADTAAAAAVFIAQRPRLLGLAYRMLGSMHDAEDVVQDAWLRWARTDTSAVTSPAAWLTTAVTRLCLTRLTSARVRRETYPGPWLPEPVLTPDPALGPDDTAALRDSVSLALLLTMERLTPAERAVYVLREGFGYPHREIAQIVGVGEANARQLHTRARRRLADVRSGEPSRPAARPAGARPAEPDRAGWVRLVERFLAAARDGDLSTLEALLAEDVTAWADGGGRVTAALLPVHGRSRVAGYLARLFRGRRGRRLTVAEVNGAPALLGFEGDALVAVVEVDVGDGAVLAVRLHVNPDKLAFLAGQLSQRRPPSGQVD
jgi:RNA polymerase sigma factor (sigma-70 family)